MTTVDLPRVTPFTKIALRMQNFLLRRNWMGSAGNYLMVITTTGRKSSKKFSTPIGYMRDGDTILAFNVGGQSNWYKNVLKNPQATLEIKGQSQVMHAERITDDAEIIRVVQIYQREQPTMLPRFFGIPAETSGDDLLKVKERINFLRFSR